MKILVIAPYIGRGGGTERVISLLTQEWAKNHEVVLGIFDCSYPPYNYSGRLFDLRSPGGGSVVKRFLRVFDRVRKIRQLIRRERPNHVLAFSETASLPATVASVLSGRRLTLTTSVRNNPARLAPSGRVSLRFLHHFATRVVAVSTGVREALAKDLALPSGKLAVIPNPIDLKFVSALASDWPGTQSRPSTPYILAVGRLVPQKGFDLLLEAFSDISKDLDVTLIILGEGTERNSLKTMAERLGIVNRVFMPGVVENPFSYMARSEAFVLSSRWEGWPNALVEAMASGAAVISFDCPYGPREIIQHGESGLLVPSEDAVELGRAIRSVICDRTLRERVRIGARKAAKRYDVKEVAGRWLE